MSAEWGWRLVPVTFEALPYFEGWLEVAGVNLPGTAYCPDWPRQFKVERWPDDPHQKLAFFKISSPEWPDSKSGETWTPVIYRTSLDVPKRLDG